MLTPATRPVVLVVDDHVGVRDALRALLSADYDVVEATAGREALALVRARPVDAIILDVLLPDVDGVEVLREIKALDPTRPVVMVTAVKTLHLAVTAMKLGASDYLTKPFHETELLAALRRAVRALPESRPAHASAWTEGVVARPRLLVVDRAAAARAAITIAFGRTFVVETAGDTLQALRRVDASAPDLLIVDVAHGDSDAVQLIRAARSRLPGCRILVTTDAAFETQRELAATDIQGVLGKPVYADRLLDSAAALLALAAPPRLGRDRLSPRMARTLHHLAAHHAGDLRLDTIAAAIAMSPDHLGARFRAEVGLSLKEYVIRLRVEVAKVLMVDTDDTLEAIAEAAGFCDASHLSRVLRQIAGMSPGEFRRRAKLA